ncbi:MAG: hypothetical protein A2Z18_10785 [Armatimonadetes bacterium RBG_16_58_9]|nr:MAG: hypothetical protein A2Z18_10785 [Armatimonadetes bacterium RBG_16_58_9]
MNFRNIEFLVQEAFTGIRRNGLMAFASISTIALSLGVLGAFALMAMGANNFAQAQLGKFQIKVFTDKADLAQARAVRDRILDIKRVKSAVILNRDKEYARLKSEHPNFDFAGVRGDRGNPLPYCLDVRVFEASQTSDVADKIRTIKHVHRVNEAREHINRVLALARVVKIASYAGAAILLITTGFIISNAIRLTLYARRREIRIMQLVGATNWFIRVPLVIEGVIFGAVGAVAAYAMLRIGTIYLSRGVERVARFMDSFSSGAGPGELAGALLIVGILIGAAGSCVSIRRFLHD